MATPETKTFCYGGKEVTVAQLSGFSGTQFSVDDQGACLWPSCHALCLYLSNGRSGVSEFLCNKTVVEIGSGVGLAALVAATNIVNMRRYIATDHSKKSLALLKANIGFNQECCLQPVPEVLKLNWKDTNPRKTLSIEENEEVVVIASDVIWDEDSAQNSSDCACRLLESGLGDTYILAYDSRSPYLDDFIQSYLERKFVWQTIDANDYREEPNQPKSPLPTTKHIMVKLKLK